MNHDIKQKGILPKYNISAADGSVLAGEFFVLRLDNGGSDQKHTEACRKGMRAYIKAIGLKIGNKPEAGKQYVVSKSDGSRLDTTADYFVLRFDYGNGNSKHVNASRKAIITYAKSIKNHLPKLADELLMLYDPKAWRPYFGDGRSAG